MKGKTMRKVLALIMVAALIFSAGATAFAVGNDLTYTSDSAVLDTEGESTNGQTEVRLIWIKDNVLHIGVIGQLKDVIRVEYNGTNIPVFSVDKTEDPTDPLVINDQTYTVNYPQAPKKQGAYWMVVKFSLTGLTLTSPFTLSIITEATGGHGIQTVSVDILNGYIINYYEAGSTTQVPGITPNPVLVYTALTGLQDLPLHPEVTGYRLADDQPTTINVTGENDSIDIYYIKLISVTGTKSWVGGSTPRPTIQLQLYQDGGAIRDPVTLSDGTITHTWILLDKTDNDGNAYTYSVDELQEPQGYTKTNPNATTVVNTYDVSKIDITVNKVWTGGITPRPDIQFVLNREGSVYKTSLVISHGTTSYTWVDEDAEDSQGNPYTFTVDEVSVPDGYTKMVTDFTIENTARTDLMYTVEYYYNNILDPEKTEILYGEFGSVINTYPEKPITGYLLDSDDGVPLTISHVEADNVIKVYYMPVQGLYYTVRYLELETNQVLHPPKQVDNQTYGDTVTESAIAIVGYTGQTPTTKTLTIGEADNLITFYYTLNFHPVTVYYVYAEDGQAAPTITQNYAYGDSYQILSPTLTGYSRDKDEVSGTMPDEPVVETVTYTPIDYEVTYHPNGGTGTMTDANSPYHYEDSVTILQNGFSRSGYVFNGWNTEANGSGIAYGAGDEISMPAHNLDLYAQWRGTSGPSPTYRMTLSKTADMNTAQVGDTLTYTITLRNTGTATLTNVTVEDPMLEWVEIVATLAPNASVSFTQTYVATTPGTLTNTVTASDNQAPFTQASATVVITEADIVIEEPDIPLDVPEIEEPEEVVVIQEVEVPLDIPQTGVGSPIFAYGAGALISLLGIFKKRK
jgi:uncharacterized repeat protein (TIGR02543 family)